MAEMVIEYLHGPTAGRRVTLNQNSISFGRDAQHPIVVHETYASRNHGQIDYTDGQWILTNHSPNGTVVNRKKVTNKPIVLNSGDEVSIHHQPMFRVHFQLSPVQVGDKDQPAAESVDATRATNVQEQAESDARAASQRRIIIIMSVMAFWVIIFMAAFLFMPDTSEQNGNQQQKMLTGTQIEQIITAPPDPIPAPSEIRYQEHLAKAQAAYQDIGVKSSAMYQAYHNYKLALYYSGKNYFDDAITQRNFTALEDRLVERVDDMYFEAFNVMRSERWNQADRMFRQLLVIYPDPESAIYRRIISHLNHIQRNVR